VNTPPARPQTNLPANYTGILLTCVKQFPNIRTAFVSSNRFFLPYFISYPDERDDIIAPTTEIPVNKEL
jgi:hypothetical protein